MREDVIGRANVEDTPELDAYYGELLDGMVADEQVPALPTLRTGTLMDDAGARARLAEETLAFAESLAP